MWNGCWKWEAVGHPHAWRSGALKSGQLGTLKLGCSQQSLHQSYHFCHTTVVKKCDSLTQCDNSVVVGTLLMLQTSGRQQPPRRPRRDLDRWALGCSLWWCMGLQRCYGGLQATGFHKVCVLVQRALVCHYTHQNIMVGWFILPVQGTVLDSLWPPYPLQWITWHCFIM